MTNMSIKDVGLGDLRFIINHVGRTGAPAAENAGKTADFGEVMNRSRAPAPPVGQRDAYVVAARAAGGQGNAPNESKAVAADEGIKTDSTGKSRTPATEAGQKTANGEYDSKAKEAIGEAIQSVVEAISAKTDIPEEDIIAILATLGMDTHSLLDTAGLGEVVAALSGSDTLTLVTDEAAYSLFTELTAQVESSVADLLEKTGLEPDELQTLLAAIQNGENTEVESPIDPLTESVNVVNETVAAQQAEPEGEIKIIIERDGVVTEITAKTDANGNTGATKDVITSEAAAPSAVEHGGQTSSESKQGTGRDEGKGQSGQEGLLNQLTQDRIGGVEARVEPIILPQSVDTEMIMRQIMDYMKIQLSPEIDRLEMQLHPAHLGTVGVKIASNAGVITAQFTAQNETVKAAIESQIVELKESLRSQGIRVESVEVEVESQAFNSALWQGREETGAEEQPNRKSSRRINLSGLEADELPEDLSGEEKLTAEMMMANGQTVDFTA